MVNLLHQMWRFPTGTEAVGQLAKLPTRWSLMQAHGCTIPQDRPVTEFSRSKWWGWNRFWGNMPGKIWLRHVIRLNTPFLKCPHGCTKNRLSWARKPSAGSPTRMGELWHVLATSFWSCSWSASQGDEYSWYINDFAMLQSRFWANLSFYRSKSPSYLFSKSRRPPNNPPSTAQSHPATVPQKKGEHHHFDTKGPRHSTHPAESLSALSLLWSYPPSDSWGSAKSPKFRWFRW